MEDDEVDEHFDRAPEEVWGAVARRRDDFAVRSARLNLRATAATVARLRQAADLLGQDVTSFVVGTALERAHDVVERECHLRTEIAQLATALWPPPGPDEGRGSRLPDDPGPGFVASRFDPLGLGVARDPRLTDDPELAALQLRSLKRFEAGFAAPDTDPPDPPA
jgi:uncharacterized protein (DUF1778 family)